MSTETKSLESRTNEITSSRGGKLFQIVQGYGLPILGGLAGYCATEGSGGFGVEMALSSFGMACLDENCPYLTNLGYKTGFVVGIVMAVMRGCYLSELASQK